MKTIQVNIIRKNLQLPHRMHHKLENPQILDLLEFQLELSVKDKIHLIPNLI